MTSKAQKHLGGNPRQEQNSEAKMKREGQHFKATVPGRAGELGVAVLAFPSSTVHLHQSLYHRNVFLTTLPVCLPHPGIGHLCCQSGHQSGAGGVSPRLVQRDSRHLDCHCCGAAGRPFHHGGCAGVVAGKTAASQLGVGHLVGKSRSLWGECGQRETSLTRCNEAMPAPPVVMMQHHLYMLTKSSPPVLTMQHPQHLFMLSKST